MLDGTALRTDSSTVVYRQDTYATIESLQATLSAESGGAALAPLKVTSSDAGTTFYNTDYGTINSTMELLFVCKQRGGGGGRSKITEAAAER